MATKITKVERDAIIRSILNLQVQLRPEDEIRRVVIQTHGITDALYRSCLATANESWGDDPSRAKTLASLEYLARKSIENASYAHATKAIELSAKIQGFLSTNPGTKASEADPIDAAYLDELRKKYGNK